MSNRLRIAVQKKGRLADDSFAMLKKCGLRFSIQNGGLLSRVKNLPIDLLLVRDDDIPGFVANGAADIGLVGENVFAEENLICKGQGMSIFRRLGFSRCRLRLAADRSGSIKALPDLQGKKIATSYPGILRQFLAENAIKATCVEMKGAVELAPRIQVADAICDLVSSGATLEANGLAAFETVLESEAVLIGSNASLGTEKQQILERLLRRIDGVIRSKDSKYIMLNAPRSQIEAISQILPGSDAPTIVPLGTDEDLVAMQAVCTEQVFWETLEALQENGARSILVLPIEKMMA
jgi:ATP phosphoribosyltransferase